MSDVPTCDDCGAQMQFFGGDERMVARCPWVTSTHRRVEHDEPDMLILYCDRPKRQDPHVKHLTARDP
jgi:hypothetical protein